MSFNITNTLSGRQIQTTSRIDAAHGASGRTRGSSSSAVATDLVQKRAEPGAVETPGSALETQPVPPVENALIQAVDQANSTAETAFRGSQRSVSFNVDEGTGRVVIRIREVNGGKTTERQIPPDDFMQMVKKLSTLNEGSANSVGLVDRSA